MNIANTSGSNKMNTTSTRRKSKQRDRNIPPDQLEIFARIGGFGGLVLFVFLTLFSRFADLKPIFGNLSPEQTYRLLLMFMVLVFVLAIFGLVCWVFVNNQRRESRSVRVGLLILMALVAFGIGAWATINQTKENVARSLSMDKGVVAIAPPVGTAADTYPTQPPPEATFVLQSGDYADVGPGQPVDCPHCKDLFYSTKPLTAPAGKMIASVEVISRSPTTNNHWYRCGIEANCGAVAEFSDLNDHSKSCIGTPACMVWRASDGRVGNETDTIRITWH